MFRDNLKDLIEYKGLHIKELAAIIGISKRTIDTYVDNRAVIPNAEIAVKLARALGTTVEFLMTGADSKNEEQRIYSDFEIYRKYKNIALELDSLPPELFKFIAAMIHTAAEISGRANHGKNGFRLAEKDK